jgi:WASH complex subunit 7
MCTQIVHDDNAHYCFHYRDILLRSVKHFLIKPLCREIENDLRLHVHTKHLDHMHSVNPKTENLKPIKPLLQIADVRVLGIVIEIKNEVSHYLNQNFYNLTTVALHDWRTYSDMRQLALDKYDLSLMDNFLPMGSLDQGLDVLQIMRNIHIFVNRFVYNMNLQMFIEYRGDSNKASKHCNTIRIQSIAASIRQHGLGVLNTTVNFTYQFLSSKFQVFSQFLFDDYIKAYLSREHRWFKKHKLECNNVYPYERALKFVREIRKLGVNDANKSFLDQFRILVTEIGNALGYVRMVRSASMYYCSEAVKYLPDFDDLLSFADYAGEGKVSTNDDNEVVEGECCSCI